MKRLYGVLNGIDALDVFGALNDNNNVIECVYAVKCGAYFESVIFYEKSPVHTFDPYIEYAIQLIDLDAVSICIKDMIGLLTPYRKKVV